MWPSRATGLVAVTAWLLAAPIAVLAQDEAEPAPWVQMTIVDVVPALTTEFLAAQRELAALDRARGLAWRRVARTAEFGETYRFIVMTPLARFAQLDGDSPTDAGRASAIARVQRTLSGRRSYAVRRLPGVDHPLPDGTAPSLMVVQLVSVVPGREQDYLQLMMTDVLPHFDEAEMHHDSGALTFGGEGGFLHVFHVENFAALDRGSPVARALGAEGARTVLSKMSGMVRSTEQWVARHVPELSFEPGIENDPEADGEASPEEPEPR